MRLDLWVRAYKTASSNIHTLKRNHQPITSPNKLLDLGKIPQPPAVDKANQKDLEDSCRWRLRPLSLHTILGDANCETSMTPRIKLKANFKDDSCLEAMPKKVTGKPLNQSPIPHRFNKQTHPTNSCKKPNGTPRIGQWHLSSPGDLVTGVISDIISCHQQVGWRQNGTAILNWKQQKNKPKHVSKRM